nr:hypothetical protein CFP56_68234 [Quercus suber]
MTSTLKESGISVDPKDHILRVVISYWEANTMYNNLANFPVGLGKIAKLINAGKIDSSELITMKTLKDTEAIGKQIKDGVGLMG